jgi:hypothetical protein
LETVQVAFVDVPLLLRELSVALLRRESRIDFRAFELRAELLEECVAEGGVQVLVTRPDVADSADISRLLQSYPRLKALVVHDEGRHALFYELRPNREERDLCAATLTEVIASARGDWDEFFGSAA